MTIFGRKDLDPLDYSVDEKIKKKNDAFLHKNSKKELFEKLEGV
jgi:hypothetical protein